MKWIGVLDRIFVKAEEIILARLLVSMVVLAALQVLLRNVWNTGIDWADISLQNATLFLGLLGAAIATSEGRHLNIDLIARVAQGRRKYIVRAAIGIFGIVVCVMLTAGGWDATKVNYEPWTQNIPSGWSVQRALFQQLAEGEFPPWLSQLLLPVGFALVAFHFVLRLIRDLETIFTGRPWDSEQLEALEGDALLDEMKARAKNEGGAR